jgi:group I intron endonuclease
MTNESLFYLYKITNQINSKVYIGQAQDYLHRWTDHRRAVRLNKPTQIVHHAMIKYGLDTFEFEVIACCKTQDNANELETILVAQYDSFIKNGKGYNATLGGMNAPKSEEWKQSMREWHASMSPEEKNEWADKIAQAHIGLTHTEETKALLSIVRSGAGNSNWGKKQSEETISKRVDKLRGKKRTDEQRRKIKESAVNRIMPLRIAIPLQQENEMRDKFANGMSLRALAREYSFSRSLIMRIVGRKRKSNRGAAYADIVINTGC